MPIGNVLGLTNNSKMNDIANKIWCEFYTSQTAPFSTVAVNGGTLEYPSCIARHPGIKGYNSSTSANSGWRIGIDGTQLLLVGGERTTLIFRTPTVQTTTTRRMGYHTSTDSNAPVDGAYAEIVDGVLSGKTSNGSTKSTTGSTYTLSNATWYRLSIQVASDLSKVTYTLYADDSSTVLWADTLATNIPTTNKISFSDIATSSGTTAINLGHIDYIDMIIPNARRVV